MAELIFRIVSERPADILMINRNVTLSIVAFFERAMDKDPDVSFQTGERSAAALRDATGGAAIFTADSAAGGVYILL